MKKVLMGNQAIAYGAVEAGVQVAAAYPGTPSSEIFSTLASLATEHNIYAEWSTNEKVALEVAAGAAYAGARAMVTMKQVGLNVAADPLMTLAYIGVKGGLVVVVADDPGPHSSQNEQDTRQFAQFAKLPVLEPSTPQEAKDMTVAAFEISERLGLPVILRPTTRTCHACQDVTLAETKQQAIPSGFVKSPNWVIFPPLAYKRHQWLNQQQQLAQQLFNDLPFNKAQYQDGELAVVASGVAYNYVMEALAAHNIEISVLKIGTPYPLPEQISLEYLRRFKRVLVVEELEPVVEQQLMQLAYRHNLPVEIVGKEQCFVPREGELDVDKVTVALTKFLEIDPSPKELFTQLPELPLRTPVLCAGCPHRASFYIFKQVAGQDAILTGDIGCYTLGNMPPLNAVDTCLCMGASITLASGLKRVEKHRKVIAFLGDSTFFHTGIPGLVNAVYNNTDITVVILDNRTTAMTGHQPHPGLQVTATGSPAKGIDIAPLVSACGVEHVQVVNPFNYAEAKEAAQRAIDHRGPAVVIMRQECIALSKGRKPLRVNPEICLQCQLCVEELGCPAIFIKDGQPQINNSCSGCGLCTEICPAGAIEEVPPCN